MAVFLPMLIVPGVAAARIARNWSTDEADKANQASLAAQDTRNQGVVDRLTAGPAPPISHWSEQQLERMIKTNSAFRDRASELRDAREQSGATRPKMSSMESATSMPQV